MSTETTEVLLPVQTPPEPEEYTPVTKDNMMELPSVITLGKLVTDVLEQVGLVTVYIDKNNQVSFCPPLEPALDLFEEVKALEILSGRGYTDENLEQYLSGRDSRLEHLKNRE